MIRFVWACLCVGIIYCAFVSARNDKFPFANEYNWENIPKGILIEWFYHWMKQLNTWWLSPLKNLFVRESNMKSDVTIWLSFRLAKRSFYSSVGGPRSSHHIQYAFKCILIRLFCSGSKIRSTNLVEKESSSGMSLAQN